MHEGRSVMAGSPEEVFGDAERLKSFRLGLPRSVAFQRDVEKLFGKRFGRLALTEEQLAETIADALKEEGERLMLEKMIFGRYVPGDSFVHRLDPRIEAIIRLPIHHCGVSGE